MAAALASLLTLGAAAAGAGYVAWKNKDRADRWQEIAETFELRAAALDEALLERTEDLNQRTTELNRMAAKVKSAELAIDRSEADVKRLERRQRRLAAEKAVVEDARAALAVEAETLEGVAQAFVDCNNGLSDLLAYVVSDDYYAANTIVEDVRSACDTADGMLSEYLATQG